MDVYVLLAAGTDVVHALAMLIWGLGLPLLVWHRWPRLSAVYTAYALTFLIVSQVSHVWLGECFLTTLARELWRKTGVMGSGDRISFTTRVVETLAGIRPSEESSVLIWEVAILLTAFGVLVRFFKLRHASNHGRPDKQAIAR
jgi:hypothetical protein